MFRRASPRSFAAALRDLEAPEPEVRVAAAADLASHAANERDPVERTLARTLADPAPAVRAAAALALADAFGPTDPGEPPASLQPPTHDALRAAIDDEAPEVRAMALAAVGELELRVCAAAVAGRLADEQPEVRFQAVIAYPRVAARAEAIAALVAATEDDDPLIRHIALRMAEEVGGEQPDDSVDDALLERARALLDDPATVVQVAAAIVLGRAGRRDGAALLADVVNGEITTSEAEDEAAAVELCGELRIKAARDGLRKRAFSGGWLTRRDTFAWQARVALAQLGNARAERWILSELTAFTRERRCLAVEAVARARLPAARPLLEAMRGDPARAEPEAVQKALAALDADGD